MSFAADELGHETAERRTLPSGIRWQNKSIEKTAAALFESESFADAQFVGMQFIL